jgi:signal peptidase II
MQLVYLLVIAGALGNMIDRVRQNYVVDFIYFRIINFPNFNVADMCVTGACILLIVLMLFVYKDDEPLTIFSKKKTGEQV